MITLKLSRCIFLWFFLLLSVLKSQENNTNINQKTELLDEIVLKPYLSYEEHMLLKKRVLKVSPYVDSIILLVKEVDSEILLHKRRRITRKYLRKKQRELTSIFYAEISSLSRKEGVILCKLVFRELNVTVYDLIKKYRGGFNAFMWNNLSKLYDGDLKIGFDAANNAEDQLIESICDKNK